MDENMKNMIDEAIEDESEEMEPEELEQLKVEAKMAARRHIQVLAEWFNSIQQETVDRDSVIYAATMMEEMLSIVYQALPKDKVEIFEQYVRGMADGMI